ncbi:MAG: restriction endonuclease subunit S [Planctomycetes bacterium]|nr:restriction endonuclease subunit S [Planctomycetota bacterium]
MSVSTRLPPGWAAIPLRDLGEWSGGGTPSKSVSSFWTAGSIPWVSPKDMKVPVISDSLDHITDDAVRASTVKLIPAGSVLIVTRSGILAHTLPVARTAVAVTVNQDIKALTPTPPIDPDFVAWGARALGWPILNACSKDGTTVASVDTTLLQDFRLPVAPAAEQHRIVSAIESYFTRLDDAVATLERVQRNLKRYRASVLKAAVEGRLVPTEAELARAEGRSYEPASVLLARILAERRRRWEEAELAKMTARGKAPKDDRWKAKYVEPVAPDTSELPELPEGWCWATADQLAIVGTGATPKRGDARFWSGGQVPWVTSAVVNDSLVATPSEFVTHTALRETNLTLYPPGTLLVAMYGEGKTRGRATTLGIESATNQALAALELRGTADYLRDWLLRFLEHNYLELRRAASGGVQPNLNLGIVRAICVPLPPVAEQRRVSEEADRSLSIAHATYEALTANELKASRLRQSILKWAFEGRLVDQDPTDEPASVLLERIRAERASATVTPPRRARRTKKGTPKS